MQKINILALCLLHWVHILHARYVTCFCALVCWYLEHKIVSLRFACTKYVLLLTLMLKKQPIGIFQVYSGIKVFITCQYCIWVNISLVNDNHMYQRVSLSKQELVRHGTSKPLWFCIISVLNRRCHLCVYDYFISHADNIDQPHGRLQYTCTWSDMSIIISGW